MTGTSEIKLESANAKAAMDIIEKLTLIEMSELVKALETKFGVTAAAGFASRRRRPRPRRSSRRKPNSASCCRPWARENQGDQSRPRGHRSRLKEAKDLVEGAPKAVKEGPPSRSRGHQEAARGSRRFRGAEVTGRTGFLSQCPVGVREYDCARFSGIGRIPAICDLAAGRISDARRTTRPDARSKRVDRIL